MTKANANVLADIYELIIKLVFAEVSREETVFMLLCLITQMPGTIKFYS